MTQRTPGDTRLQYALLLIENEGSPRWIVLLHSVFGKTAFSMDITRGAILLLRGGALMT